MNLPDLFRWDGTISRRRYALVGVVGFALKHNIDRLVASTLGRRWDVFNYWIPLDQAVRFTSLPREDAAFLLVMAMVSLPFIWVGVGLTLRRLRSMGWPSWPVVFFFFPFGNLAFFLFLSLMPSRPVAASEPRPSFLRRLIPDSAAGSAAVALLLTVLVGLIATVVGTEVLTLYGWGLFVALPFCLGLTSTLLHGYHQPRSLRSCLLVSLMSTAFLALALLALLLEGLMCIAMMVPLAVPLALLGGWIGYLIQRRPMSGAGATAMILFSVLAAPLLMGAEYAVATTPPVYEVTTGLEIAAPPEVVWRNVVGFPPLPAPSEWIFRSGIAYPVRAEIRGHGVGGVRWCVFSTGTFIEPIEVWDEPRLLKFSVETNPEPMRELSFAEVRPAHLKGYFHSFGGQFRLVPLDAGHTRLEGTTWYQHRLWPATYWRAWSDAVIHRIHLRVLRHIRSLSQDARPSS